MVPSPLPTIQKVSESFVKPQYDSEESKQPYYLTAWDLAMLSTHYIQKGLLYKKPLMSNDQGEFTKALLDKLKQSLSLTLVYFYPLAGRLITQKNENPSSCLVYLDCTNSPGAKFIHATSNLTISDVLDPLHMPREIVHSFFDHTKAINHDGHNISLLSIQVTELIDGVFVGCSINHSVVDGTSFWHVLNAWSEVFRSSGNEIVLSRPPVLERWFPDGKGPIINLPFTHEDEFLSRFESPPLVERVFHFTSDTIAKLKAQANSECKTDNISSFQSLSAFVWISITKARSLPHDEKTNCIVPINNRSRLDPPLSASYFGNSIDTIKGVAKAGELIENGLGWAAWKLHQLVVTYTTEIVHESLENWLKSPSMYQLDKFFEPNTIMMSSSPRFDKYGIEFGLGKPVALRSGYANKLDSIVTWYPGYEGGGSVDLEICLREETMRALESNMEFMDVVASPNRMY